RAASNGSSATGIENLRDQLQTLQRSRERAVPDHFLAALEPDGGSVGGQRPPHRHTRMSASTAPDAGVVDQNL
ncbi:MAG: hypothetical protein MPN21_25280, partial [Thermoanaerobaculia bacterium]|nr:hypothetical protein [Thermoanaerobaculia bacterium]